MHVASSTELQIPHSGTVTWLGCTTAVDRLP